MPRLARLDAPGILHHIIIRGIDRTNIFKDNKDRDNFIERLSELLPKTKTACYAWAFLPNHAHFLIRSGPAGLSALMRRLLTGYAGFFNRRHKRHGHLFQNRYKSIVCQEEVYFNELIRYIHLNPLRGKIVSELSELNKYSYCGHGVLIGNTKRDWQDAEYVLSHFGKTVREARRRYLAYVRAGAGQGRRPELVGGGLVRSLGGWKEVRRRRLKSESFIKGDERVLGGSDFVMQILAEANVEYDRRYKLRGLGYDLKQVADKVADIYQIDPSHIFSKSQQRIRVEARSLFSYWAARHLRIPLTEIAKSLRMSATGVGYAVQRGEGIAEKNNYELTD
jgi:putative transposase